MPSSTFSSEPRQIPAGNWRRIWVVALALAVAMTVRCETTLRSRGWRPTVVDDPVLWSMFRRTVNGDRDVVAFVGTSRLEAAYSAQAFAAVAPELRGVQLAINGVQAIGVLEDLANDSEFRGIAVVDIDEWDIASGDSTNAAREFVERAHTLWRAPGAVANRYLAALAQSKLAVLAVGGRGFLSSVIGKRRLPPARPVVADRDRTSHGDYSLVTEEALSKTRKWRLSNFEVPAMAPPAWLERARALDSLAKRIRARGGDVVFVRLPNSGELAAGFDKHYPRGQYWDAFAASSAAHVIHFRDVPALAALVCPDEMHLDQKDQGTFTRSLVGVLRDKGVIKQ